MSKALWNEELDMIVFCQLYCHMLAIRWRSLTNIYCYIKYSTLYAAYQFALGIRWALEVQASHHTIAAHRLVVLHEVDTMPKDGRYLLIEFSLREALEEIASGVFEDARLNDEHARDGCLYDVHKS